MVTAMIRRSTAVMRGIEFQIMILPLALPDRHGPDLSCYNHFRLSLIRSLLRSEAASN
jgi:hypothetical protein